MTTPVACTIAGSDSGGGAGIQADLKTFAACGVYGCSAVVALTAQNTMGVRAVQEASLEIIRDQVDAIAEDLRPAAWKTGMLSSAGVIEVVVDRLRAHGATRLVVDPVMFSKSGQRLLDEGAVTSLMDHLLPLAWVVTPNLPEVEALTGIRVRDGDDARRAALVITAMGARAVVVKGGHADTDPVVDLVHDATTNQWAELSFPRVPGTSTHGTGCTFSAGIAAHLALGLDVMEAVDAAREYLQGALERAPGLGSGHGPLGHFPVPQ
ncbi:MAG: bifunctional hydroxymethylpyrimidine kinase/phosphomethylpyrimidine kinase [Candidatus Dormibacteraeota bacterium]|nr:bifunctional hydroxymethylpyrimidine kinase/phosphomethylpyrimidine kinase [Candidatus Dormibacteraeota bacterium]